MKHFIKAIVITAVTFLACYLMSLADIDDGGVVLIIWIGTLTLLDYAMEVISKAFRFCVDYKKLEFEYGKMLVKEKTEETEEQH